MNEIIHGPWPWYISGTIMGAAIPLLLFLGNKMLGVSSTMQHICTALIPSKASYFNYNWKDGLWNIMTALGIVLGGAFARIFMYNPENVQISSSTTSDLQALGITDFSGFIPVEIMGTDQIFSWSGLIFLVLGGMLVGFGVRYAGGCTSGHGFMGLSQASLASLIAVVSFFAGGLLMTHLIFPFLF